MKYKLQEFYSLMSNLFYDRKLDTYRPKPIFPLSGLNPSIQELITWSAQQNPNV